MTSLAHAINNLLDESRVEHHTGRGSAVALEAGFVRIGRPDVDDLAEVCVVVADGVGLAGLAVVVDVVDVAVADLVNVADVVDAVDGVGGVRIRVISSGEDGADDVSVVEWHGTEQFPVARQ